MNVLGLCAGYAGLELGLGLATDGRARGICYVEREAFAVANLVAQMEAGRLAPAPVWTDLTTFDGQPWRDVVDCVTAGFPCQPWSVAGQQRGTDDERWLWPEIARIIRDVGPGLVLLENVPALASRGGLGNVLGSLAELGFDAEWGVFSAAEVGAPHLRKRLFILAYRDGDGFAILRSCGVLDGQRTARGDDVDGRVEGVADADGDVCGEMLEPETGWRPSTWSRGAGVADATSMQSQGRPVGRETEHAALGGAGWPPGPGDHDGWRQYLDAGGSQPAIRRGSHGGPSRVDELRLLGNGVVPLVAAHAFRVLATRTLNNET